MVPGPRRSGMVPGPGRSGMVPGPRRSAPLSRDSTGSRQIRTSLPGWHRLPARPRSRSLRRAVPARPSLKEAARAAALPRLASGHWHCSAAPSRRAPAPSEEGPGQHKRKERETGGHRNTATAWGIRGCAGRVGSSWDQHPASRKAAGPDSGERLVREKSIGEDSVHCTASHRVSWCGNTTPHRHWQPQQESVLRSYKLLPKRSDKLLHKPSKDAQEDARDRTDSSSQKAFPLFRLKKKTNTNPN
ncbi:uncharacterized protein LOC131585225 [Poecile atricapillus]|uniref:uncharacterized protein LOC131585225 n=1 Tax=Poecile atricapillus TaxID=48891 RepID=UPI0027397D89|nr:uncharacterized protein LOC131585225 [Poecile atricapillus]